MSVSLQELIDTIASNWTFNDTYYPSLTGLSQEKLALFAVRHIVLHQGKTLGSLSELVERCEHDGASKLDMEKLKVIIATFLRNSLRLADIAGMNAEDLERLCVPQRPFHDASYG